MNVITTPTKETSLYMKKVKCVFLVWEGIRMEMHFLIEGKNGNFVLKWGCRCLKKKKRAKSEHKKQKWTFKVCEKGIFGKVRTKIKMSKF